MAAACVNGQLGTRRKVTATCKRRCGSWRRAHGAAGRFGAAALAVVALLLAELFTSVTARASTSGGFFTPLQMRLVNTQTGAGGFNAPLSAKTWTTIDVAADANLPASSLSAVELTFTALSGSNAGYLQAVANDATPGQVSLLNFDANDHSTNDAVVAVSADGKIKVWVSASTDLVVDLQGYYSAGTPEDGGFQVLGETTIASTSDGSGGLPNGTLSAGDVETVPVAGVGGVASNAAAAMLDIVESDATMSSGVLAVYPTGSTVPPSAGIGWPGGGSNATSVPVQLGTNGSVNIKVKSGGPISLTINVLGYYTPATSSTYGAFTAAEWRVYDTTATQTPLASGETRDVAVLGVKGVPAYGPEDIVGVAANVQAIPESLTTSGNLSVYSGWDTSGLPSVYFNGGTASSSMSTVEVGPSGDIEVTNTSNGVVDITVDVEGWFDGKPMSFDDGSPASVPEAPPQQLATQDGPATVSGVLQNGGGAGLANLTVNLYPLDELHDNTTLTAIATTTTAADGSWSVTLPATLPSDVQALADANDGVLNTIAIATGITSDGEIMAATEAIPAGVAYGPASTLPSQMARSDAQQPAVMTMYPADSPNDLPTDPPAYSTYGDTAMSAPDTSFDSAQEASHPTWQNDSGPSNDGYSPEIVNGTDYTRAIPDDNICTSSSTTVGTHTRYTTVGESHAYWDAYATFIYDSRMSSGIQVMMAGPGGKHWSGDGYSAQEESIGHSTGYSNKGPHYARQWRVPIKYEKDKVTYYCPSGGTRHGYLISPDGYNVPDGWSTGKYGDWVRYKDGPGYNKAPFHGKIDRGAFYTVEGSRSITWGVAVSAFGVGISAYTDWNASHMERIDAGNQAAPQHDIFSWWGQLGHNPRIALSD